MSHSLTRILILTTLVGAAVTGIACSKSGSSTPSSEAAPATQEPATTTPPTDAPAAGASAAAAVPWESKTREQKIEVMKTVVTPTLAKSFREFSPEHFAEFNCATCHGPGAAEGNFEMPTAAIEPLVDFETSMAQHPEATKFMAERVVPETAKALGVEPYNPETHKGFGCFDCHTKRQ